MKIALLMGGRSREREISLKTGAMVARALRGKGHHVKDFDVDQGLAENLLGYKPDVAFIALHGKYGEDGTIQGLLEVLGIPYVGSGVLASALAINKVMTKKIFGWEGIPTPKWMALSKDSRSKLEWSTFWPQVHHTLGLPIVVKPSREGSTIGLSVARDQSQVLKSIDTALEYDDEILLEEFVSGVEVTMGVLGNHDPQVLPVIEIVSKTGFYDYEAKYTPGMSDHIIPARISQEAYVNAQELALRAHKALGCRGLSRVDGMVYGEGQITILEVNTIPGMTETSLFPDAARHAGIEFQDLMERLVFMALEG